MRNLHMKYSYIDKMIRYDKEPENINVNDKILL